MTRESHGGAKRFGRGIAGRRAAGLFVVMAWAGACGGGGDRTDDGGASRAGMAGQANDAGAAGSAPSVGGSAAGGSAGEAGSAGDDAGGGSPGEAGAGAGEAGISSAAGGGGTGAAGGAMGRGGSSPALGGRSGGDAGAGAAEGGSDVVQGGAGAHDAGGGAGTGGSSAVGAGGMAGEAGLGVNAGGGGAGSGGAGSGGAGSGGAGSGGAGSGGAGSGGAGIGGNGTTPLSCTPAPTGRSGEVQAPTLRATLAGSWDENWFASPALVDVDGDGLLDIVAPRHSVLYVYHGDGTPLWQTAWAHSASDSPEHGDVRMWPSAAVGDFDGDGDVEIAVSAHPDDAGYNVAVYDHEGELLPGWPQAFGSNEVRSIAAGDVDGDAGLEILITKQADGPATNVFKLDGSTAAGWPQVGECTTPAGDCIDYGGFNQNIGAGDLDGDGIVDVVSTYDAIGFGVWNGDGTNFSTDPAFADAWVTGVEAYHDLALSQQGWGTGDRSEFTYSPPVVADIDADGACEIVLCGDHEHSQSTDNQGITTWVLNPDMTRPAGWETPKDSEPPLLYGEVGSNIVMTMPVPSVGNLDGDSGLEIVVPGYDGLLHAYRSDGAELFTYRFGQAAPYVGASEALILDLNGDGVPEILFSTYSSGEPRQPETPAHLIVLDAAGRELHRVELFGRGSMAAPSVADLDGDGTLELVISLKDSLGGGDGGVQIWELPGASPNCVLWGTGRGGLLRQGYVPAE